MPKSKVVIQDNAKKLKSRLVLATQLVSDVADYPSTAGGVFGSTATIKSGGVTLNSSELDFEFDIPFDGDLVTNEGEVIVYNLSDSTIRELKANQEITIEAGYKGDTGVLFNGRITKVSTKREGADKITTIKVIDDLGVDEELEDVSYTGTASSILKDLLKKTGKPLAMCNIKHDYTYQKSVSVDGSLVDAIKTQSEVCRVSTFIRNGTLYCCNWSDLDEVNFVVSEETGMIGSPTAYTEEMTVEETTETVEGLEIEMILQHRMGAGSVIQLTSRDYKGNKYQVRSGRHIFNESEAITEIKVV